MPKKSSAVVERSANGVANGVANSARNTHSWVHRCRFMDWEPSAIGCLAFHPDGNRLAVARANGNIELWNIGNHWSIERIVYGKEDFPVTKLLWTGSGRLFGTCMNGTIFEVDFFHLVWKNIRDSNGGAVWCMDINVSSEQLAVGCEDGRVRFYSIANDSIEFVKAFSSIDSRIVSLAWHSNGEVLFSGDCDGCIHRWEVPTGQSTDRITLEQFKKEKTVVWSLIVLDDNTVVSGDSLGNIQLWDGLTCTLLQKFVRMTADVLTLTVNDDQTHLFASGVDNQVILLQKSTTHNNNNVDDEDAGQLPQWQYIYSYRSHSHDVRALAVSCSSTQKPLLVSGGLDTQLVCYSVQNYSKVRPTKISPFSQRTTEMSSCEGKRWMLLKKDTSLQLFAFPSHGELHTAPSENLKKKDVMTLNESVTRPEILVELNLSLDSNIVCASISKNGQYIACSSNSEFKLFRLETTVKKDGTSVIAVQPRKVQLSDQLSHPCLKVQFTPDCTRLILCTQSGHIRVVEMDTLEVKKTFSEPLKALMADERYEGQDSCTLEITTAISCMAVSPDSEWLSTCDYQNRLSLYHLDSYTFKGTLPRPEYAVTVMAFSPKSDKLVVADVRNQMVLYDVEKKQLAEWSKRHSKVRLPLVFQDHETKVKGILFHPKNPNYVMLYTQKCMLRVDLAYNNKKKRKRKASEVAEPNNVSPAEQQHNNTAHEDSSVATENRLYNLICKFHPIFHAEWLTSRELVVVETPWLKILQKLPEMIDRKKYGRA